MKIYGCFLLAALALMGAQGLGLGQDVSLASVAGETSSSSGQASSPEGQATLSYIHDSWDALTRSMSDCASLKDVKVTEAPVLYLPYGMSPPKDVLAAEAECHVRVLNLPKPIEKLGDIQPQMLDAQGLLYLPNHYIVPGGRFNEMYGWDSYFILLGLEAEHRQALAKGIVENFFFEIEHYGSVLNANRTYYLTRSQPPFLTSMIRAVIEDPASFPSTEAGRLEERAWLARAYAMAEKDYSTWVRPEHRAGATRLARYWDYGTGPVPEMADDNTYYIDVIRWLVAHPKAGGESFLIKAAEHPDPAVAVRLKQSSCDVQPSVVCMLAWFDGYRLSRSFYAGDRAMRESGFDTSDRFGPFSGATADYAPVGLNCLLFRYERDMEHFAHLLALPRDAMLWDRRAQARNAAIQQYMWRAKDGNFADFDFVHMRSSNYAFITSLYPLWTGVATREEEKQMEAKLALFERAGGLSTSDYESGLQWDEPYGWAPTNWLAVAGLQATGYREDAARIAKKFNDTVDRGFAADGTIREKYNVVTESAHVTVMNGYKQNVIGFGWTNAVYLKMRALIREDAAGLEAPPGP